MASGKGRQKKLPETGGEEKLFSKEQLLAAKRFRERRDLADALLEPGRRYSAEEVEQMMENYRKGKVE